MEYYFSVLKLVQKGDDERALLLIKQFYPLIKKYSLQLGYEDAYYDLENYLINIIYTINLDSMNNVSDGSILKYITASIYHDYIRLSKKYNKIKANEYIVCNEDIKSEIMIPVEDDFSNLLFNDIKKHLTSREYKVIFMFFHGNFTTHEIAKELKETTHNIYKIKSKALEKLRKIFLD